MPPCFISGLAEEPSRLRRISKTMRIRERTQVSVSLAFDISSWQRRPPLSWFQQMKAAGYDLCWIQLWGLTPDGNGPNPHAEYQLAQAHAAGLRIGGYIVIYGDTTDDTSILVQVALAAAGAEKEHLTFVALDVETAPIRIERLLNAYDNIGSQLPGVVRAMYTSRWKWTVAFGTAEWPHAASTPLLEARYVYNSGSAPATPPDLEWFWLPFGGWAERAMLQYAGTVPTFGVGVDRCVYKAERMKFGAPAPEEEGELTMGQYEELKGLIAGITGAVSSLGQKIATLEAATHKHSSPAPAPTPPAPRPGTKPYTVMASDGAEGLSGIASRKLGDANRWPEIASLNGLNEPYTIYENQVLLLPTSGPAPTPPAPAPPPPPPAPAASAVEYVIVVHGDYASKWFDSEVVLLRLNPDFKTVAYNADGSVMRRFASRDWGEIYPPERLRIK